jgi:hypothetical protein
MRRRCGLGAIFAATLLIAAPAYGACGASEYSYAGLSSRGAVRGVSATITTLLLPQVRAGHVAGWIGVVGQAANGQYAWLQIGLSASAGGGAREIYVELSSPGRDPWHMVLRRTVPLGQTYRLAVLEVAGRPGWWRAWLDGAPVIGPVHLAGSHDRWKAQVTAESWNDATGACNLFSYAFGRVKLVTAAEVSQQGLSAAELFQDPGYGVSRASFSSFVAASIPFEAVRTSAGRVDEVDRPTGSSGG